MAHSDAPPARRWIRWLGTALILLVWLPVLYCAGGLGLAALSARRARAAGAAAHATVRPGATLGEVVRTTSDAVGGDQALQCYEAACLDPAGLTLAKRPGGWFGTFTGDGPFERFGELPRDRLDAAPCRRAQVTFCGRPRMGFVVDLDEQRRVRKVGSLGISAD